MLLFVTLFILLVKLIEAEQCPRKKTVGGTCFKRVDDKIDTSSYNCKANCSYTDPYGQKFCFKSGPYKVEDTCPCDSEPLPPTPGENCNRNCINNSTILNCTFTFHLQQLYTNHSKRRADGLFRPVLVYNGRLPGPTIAVCYGDWVTVTLINGLKGNDSILLGGFPNATTNTTTLHFHGIREKQTCNPAKGGPWSDGVPLVTQCPIPSGKNFTYTFGAINGASPGTYWYHSHMGRQRMNGAEGKLIIMERTNSTRFDIDLPENSLFLMEWNNITCGCCGNITGLLVNGKTKQSKSLYTPTGDDEGCFRKYKEGEATIFKKIDNPQYSFNQTDYEVFNITYPGKQYRFRIIGASGDDVPIRVSIENHTFTAIATDSQDIVAVPNLSALWVTSGERYDIVIKTKKDYNKAGPAYKINILHKPHFTSDMKVCSLAWLKYGNQTIDRTFEANCTDMVNEPVHRVLNPIPNNYSEWINDNYIYPSYLKSINSSNGLPLLNKDPIFVTMYNMTFNNYSMCPKHYPDIPFLFQSPAPSPSSKKERCGTICKGHQNFTSTCTHHQPKRCGEPMGKPPNLTMLTTDETICNAKNVCHCQHVIQQPWFDAELLGLGQGKQNYFEVILINTNIHGVAHPIHQHGGWFRIVAMDQFNDTIYLETVKELYMKKNITLNLKNPPYKDTIQVPPNGYVIFRTPVDNRGNWIIHCHINWHVEHGMAMIFQIGEPNRPLGWSMGPNKTDAHTNMNRVCQPN